MSKNLRNLFLQRRGNFGHRGRPGQVGGSAPSGAGPISKFDDMENFAPAAGKTLTEEEKAAARASYDKPRVNPDLADIQMTSGHLDFRALGEREMFPITNYGIPDVGQDMDFYDINGDKLYGRVSDIDGSTISFQTQDPLSGRSSSNYNLQMVDWKSGYPVRKRSTK